MKSSNQKLFLIILAVMSIFAVNVSVANAQTYRNPIINADVPDISLCNDGENYYMISTTMHLMPGAPIMRSKDLMHWEIVSYVFPRIEDGDRYDLIDNKTVYGQGQWASSIRYHKGKFYVWFTANGAPGKGFLYTADKAEGPWTLVTRPPHFHDGSLFFDEDGKVYIFYGTGDLTELDPVTFERKQGGLNIKTFERDADERGLLEGSSVMKHNGKYYLCMISMVWGVPGRVRREVCYRADKIEGPYEKKVILETPFESYGGVGQGSLVEPLAGTEYSRSDDGWNAVIFQDRGGIGRVPCLMPCRWVDGWPMLGDENGKIPNDLSIPHIRQTGVIDSDEFDSDKPLKLVWQFNHNPIDDAWSLTNGALRLKTARIVDNIFVAPNTITQRMEGPKSEATVCINISKMKDGDHCGFSAYNGNSGVLDIVKDGKNLTLNFNEEVSVFERNTKKILRDDVQTIESIPLAKKQKVIYLRIAADFLPNQDLATFSYSLDGKTWKTFEHKHKMQFDYTRMFMGSKWAIFNYATKELGGYIDVDWFRVK